MYNKDKERIHELKELIAKYDKQYYEEGVSDISDAEYDRLYDEYLQFEAQYPELKNDADAPTKRVGAGDEAGSTTGLPKFTHKSPLLSIDRKAKEISQLKDFYEKCGGDGVEVIIEPKLDGITCNINYENGVLVNAATRGNGYIGDLITDNFKMTDTKYPDFIESNAEAGADLEIRGEAIIPYDYFKANLTDEYSNPRNAVAGIMRQIDPKEVKDKGIQVMFYDVGTYERIMFENYDSNNVDFVKLLGFGSVPILTASTYDELESIVSTRMNGMIQEIDGFNVLVAEPTEKERGIGITNYPQAVCDGLVIKVNDKRIRDEIGFSEKGPKWAFAYKFKPLQAETRIDHIEWQVGKSGRITPVAVFDEISLGGTKITKATLNNYDYMKNLPVLEENKNDGLQLDDIIIVERANDVIPRVVAIKKHQNCVYNNDFETTQKVAARKETFNQPKVCPVCAGHVKEAYPLYYCGNHNCPAKAKGLIEHYASRDAMNIVGLGEGIINTLFESNILTDIPSIYSLKDHKDELEALPKFGKKKVEKLLKSIEDTKKPELWQFIYALSIEGVGKKTAKDLAQRFHTLQELKLASFKELLEIQDMGDITSQNIIDFLDDEDVIYMIDSLLAAGVEPKSVEIAGDKFKGKTFVITGTLTNPRKYYQDIIEKNGGKVSGSVSKKTNVVIVGEDAGSKEEKARKLVADGADILILDSEESVMRYLNE